MVWGRWWLTLLAPLLAKGFRVVLVEVENKSRQVVRLTLDEDGEQLQYLRKLLKRDELERVDVLPKAPAARKPAAGK